MGRWMGGWCYVGWLGGGVMGGGGNGWRGSWLGMKGVYG